MEELQSIRCKCPVWIFNPDLKNFLKRRQGTKVLVINGKGHPLTTTDINGFIKYGYFLAERYKIVKEYKLKDEFKNKFYHAEKYIANNYEFYKDDKDLIRQNEALLSYKKDKEATTTYIVSPYLLDDPLDHTWTRFPLRLKSRNDSLNAILKAINLSFNQVYERIYKYDYETLERAYCYNHMTGESLPLLMVTKCNHCEFCKEGKSNHWTSRNQLEFANAKQMPIFVTLTYNNDNYPQKDYDLRIQSQEVRAFIKRLRQNLHRYFYKTDFRYFLVSEFGKKHHRLHFHILLYNVDSRLYKIKKSFINGKDWFRPLLAEYVDMSWTKGFNTTIITHPYEKVSNGQGTETQAQNEVVSDVTQYLCKYMTKGDDCNIMLHSNHFGLETILKNKEYIKKTIDNDNKEFELSIKGKPTKFAYSKYIISHICPSLTQSMSLQIRKYLKGTMYWYHRYLRKFREDPTEFNLLRMHQLYALEERISRLYYLAELLSIDTSVDYVPVDDNADIYKTRKILFARLRYLEHNKEIKNAYLEYIKLHLQHKHHTSMLMSDMPVYDMVAEIYAKKWRANQLKDKRNLYKCKDDNQ